MTVDLVDLAFLKWLAEPVAPEIAAAPPEPAVAARHVPPSAAEDPVVATLLATCPEEWARLADHVEAAWAAGAPIVAVAGRARGDGVSTVVRGLTHVLHGRPAAHGPVGSDCGDRRALVDGGVWFPPGPVHRGRLARAASGCHAAVLVRRAGRAPCPAHAAALAALGIRVLGEVVTFADASAAAPESA